MGKNPNSEVIQVGDLTLDVSRQSAINKNKVVRLTPQECRLLYVFMQHPGEILSRAFLMRAAWDWEISHPNEARTLEVHVCWLRQKLEEDPRRPRLIRTVRGVGYQFDGGD